jgi:predicted porin
MKSAVFFRGFLACLVVLALSLPAAAAITLYDKEGMTFSTDGSFNTFYVISDSEKNAEMEAIVGPDRQQSRWASCPTGSVSISAKRPAT